MNRYLAAALALILVAAVGCGGSGSPDPVQPGNPDPVLPDGSLHTRVLRDASGVPQGVSVTWAQVADADNYHLYRSATPIPDSARGNEAFMVEIDGSTLIPEPSGAGLNVAADDVHPVVIGETWYYRISALNLDNEESFLSEEAEITISSFVVEELLNTSVRVGEPFRIRGINFGTHAPGSDLVQVRGVRWVNGVGFEDAMLDCSVIDWTPGLITCTLPLGATNGEVEVTIGGDTQETPEVLDNADPYIESLTPVQGFVNDVITIDGAHFGAGPSPDNRVVFDGTDPAAVSYASYADDQIVLSMPSLGVFKIYSLAVRMFAPAVGEERESNLGFFDFRNSPPVTYLSGTPAAGFSPLDVTFSPGEDIDGSGLLTYSFDPDGKPLAKYDYDFTNDGTVDVSLTTQTDVVHQYTKEGPGTPALSTCTDADGASSSKTFDVVAGSEIPTAVIDAVPLSGHAPLNVSLDGAGSSDPDGVIVKYEWDFDGDGTYDEDTGGSNKTTFWYNFEGTYDAVLRVTDDDGATDTDTIQITVQPSMGYPILVVRNDGGLYQENYDAIISDLDDIGADYDELSYHSTIADSVAGGEYRMAIWYRGGKYNVDTGAPMTNPWTDEEVDNYLKIMQDGGYVLLFSQNHGQIEGNEGAVQNAWETFYRFNMQPETLTNTQRRHAWAAGLATNLFAQPVGFNAGIPTRPDSFLAGAQDAHFSTDSVGCAEQYNGGGSSGQVPTMLDLASAQYCGLGYESSLVAPEASSSGFQPGIYVENPLLGHDCGMLSWGNSAAPDENIGSGPAYNHVAGPGKLWIIGYGWGTMQVTAPVPGPNRSAVLQNILAWFAPDLLPPG